MFKTFPQGIDAIRLIRPFNRLPGAGVARTMRPRARGVAGEVPCRGVTHRPCVTV